MSKEAVGRRIPPVTLSRGTILSTGTYEHQNFLNALESVTDTPLVQDPKVNLAISGLEKLQLTSDKGATWDVIDTALAFRHSNLPTAVQKQIYIPRSRDLSFFRDSAESTARAIARLDPQQNPDRKSPEQQWWRQVGRHEYTLWPANENGDHMFVIILRMGQCKSHRDSDSKRSSYDKALDVGLAEGVRTTGTRRGGGGGGGDMSSAEWHAQKRVLQKRIARVMLAAGFVIAAEMRFIDMWVPAQTERYECGLRSFFVIRQMMERTPNIYIMGRRYEELLWSPLSGWFHPEQVRAEVAGDCQWSAIRGLDYKARIAVELVRDNEDRPLARLRPPKEDLVVQRPGGWEFDPQVFLTRYLSRT